MDYVREAENLGYDTVWTAEAWGSDALTPAAWVLAQTSKIKVGTGIVQMSARTPSSVAMAAMSLDHLSGGRFILGLGPSGPQVIEGWYGVPYGRPLTRLREYVEIIRKILARKEPLRHEGFHYQIPMTGEGTTGLGKPLKSVLHGNPDMKIVSAAISSAGVKAAAEIVDGFIPIYMDPDRYEVFEPDINAGLEKAGGGKSLSDFMVLAFCQVRMDDDLMAARQPVRENLAFYIGGMGARDKNFYNDFAKRLGYVDAAVEIQDHFLAGRRKEAADAVPDELIDRTALVGPKERIIERLQDWKKANDKGQVHTIVTRGASVDALRVLAENAL
jgi:F420-dependent oxidoreductase-like protein